MDRYEAAANISESFFEPGTVPVAYVASGKVFPDALAAGPVAGLRSAPILLTNTRSLPVATSAELDRLKPGEIVVLGGPNSVDPSVESALRSFTGGGVSRIGGADRWEAAANISASYFDPGVPVAYVASGKVFPDALAAGPVAGLRGGPVLLTSPGTLPAATKAELERLQPEKIVVLGGFNTVNWWVQTDLSPYVAARPVAEYLPLPDDANTSDFTGTEVAAVSCPDEGECVAVGTYAVAGGDHAPVIWEQDGTSWAAQPAPLPADATAGQPEDLLLDVSCESVGECVAVGRYENTDGAIHELALTASASTWDVTPIDVAGAGAVGDRFWSHVSCAQGVCGAVGSQGRPGSTATSIYAHRDAGTWTAQVGIHHTDFESLECRAGMACVAIGTESGVGALPTVARWAGSSWAETRLFPETFRSTGLDVDCATDSDCLAVGTMDNGTDEGTGRPGTDRCS